MKHVNVQLAHFLDRHSACDRWLASIHVDYVILTDGLQHTVYAPARLTRHTKACVRHHQGDAGPPVVRLLHPEVGKDITSCSESFMFLD